MAIIMVWWYCTTTKHLYLFSIPFGWEFDCIITTLNGEKCVDYLGRKKKKFFSFNLYVVVQFCYRFSDLIVNSNCASMEVLTKINGDFWFQLWFWYCWYVTERTDTWRCNWPSMPSDKTKLLLNQCFIFSGVKIAIA